LKPRIALLRRQSPDWKALAEDFQSGVPIDPRRYKPDHAIPGFPDNIEKLIAVWNSHFRTDFFTFRYLLTELSNANVRAIKGVRVYDYSELDDIVVDASVSDFYLYPYDDDDFFAPYIPDVCAGSQADCDTIVTPMYRIANENYTFVRPGCTPDQVLNYARPHDYRFQTNNYGVHSRHLRSLEGLKAVKDHVEASSYAERRGFVDCVLPKVVSATIKTPAAASAMPESVRSISDGQYTIFKRMIENLQAVQLPPAFEWITRPSHQLARLVQAVYANERIEVTSANGSAQSPES